MRLTDSVSTRLRFKSNYVTEYGDHMAGPCDSEQKFSFYGTPPSTWKSAGLHASVLWAQIDDVFLSRNDRSQQKQHQSKFM